ncbi:MAG TPA: caspase family protein [Blastocatellia bacterium]|nr:caspase family protein [Blastocatellia bacterium]
MRRTISLLILGLCIFSLVSAASGWQKQKTKPAPQQKTAPPANKTPDAKPPVSKTPQPPPADDQWALLVGISDYPGQIQKLGFPRNDARAIKDLLIKSAGFREDHIRLLTDDGQGDAKATKQNILAAVDSFAPRVEAGHQMIVFLAGHGIVRGLGAQAKGFFLPVDVDAQSKDALERTGLDLEELSRRLSNLKASQFTIFIDACREDPFPGRGIKGNTMTDVMARGLRVAPPDSRPAGTEPPTAITFYACQVGERAYEDPKLEHGVFTYFILNGIRDIANRPDGRVEAGYLAAYLRENVAKWSKEFQQRAKYPVEQTPTMVATEVRGPMVIVKVAALAKDVSPPSKGTVTLIASPQEATLSLGGQVLGAGPLQKEMSPGQYTVSAQMQGFQPAEEKITVVPGVQQEITITLKPSGTNANYDKGVQFEAQKLWPQAIAAYEMALSSDPGSAAAYDRLANVYIANGRYRDAVDLLTTATEKIPDNTSLIARRSRALSLWATDDQKQDLSMNPRPKKAVKQDDARKEAIRAAELAMQKAPIAAESNLALGYAYTLDEKDYQKALPAFVKASTIASEDAEGYYGVGYTYRLLKQYPQAMPQLKKALEIRPDYYEAHRELAYCYHSTGDTDQAIKEYNTATGYRGETNNSGEMAGNHLALSALYQEKGQQVGGQEGEQISQAGKAHETDARDYDPTLKAALKILTSSGVSYRMTSYLPSELRNIVNQKSVTVPGGIKIPFPKKRP